jgi:hypothetical protein
MSRQNDIEDAIWSDPEFHTLTPHGKLLYVWSFTNERVGMAGIYKIPQSTIAHETGLDAADLARALLELQRSGMTFYDGTWVWVRARIKRLRTRTVQMCRSISKQVATVPADHPFRVALLHQDGDGFWASKDERTTIGRELGVTGVSPRSDPRFTAPRRNLPTHLGDTKVSQGQGQGKGQGPHGVGVQGEGTDWRLWAEINLPDLPADLVAMAAGRLAPNRPVMNPDEVRAMVLAQHPHLGKDAA